MKKLLASLILFLVFAQPALSLPGKTKKEIYDWVKNHQFLSTWLQDLKSPGNYHMVAFRELQDHWFFDIRIYSEDSKVEYLHLTLLKKEQTQEEPRELDDQRKWKNISCKDVWHRENETANELLLRTFNQEISKDFKESKLVFSGPNFYHPIIFDDFEAVIDRDYNGKPLLVNEMKIRNYDDQIFLGKKYSYERTYVGSFGDTSCYSLNIHPIQWGNRVSSVYQHNLKIYNDLQKKKERREKPALIKVE